MTKGLLGSPRESSQFCKIPSTANGIRCGSSHTHGSMQQMSRQHLVKGGLPKTISDFGQGAKPGCRVSLHDVHLSSKQLILSAHIGQREPQKCKRLPHGRGHFLLQKGGLIRHVLALLLLSLAFIIRQAKDRKFPTAWHANASNIWTTKACHGVLGDSL